MDRDTQLPAAEERRGGGRPPIRRQYVRFPDRITTGRYDYQGRPDPEGRLLITVRDTAFTWVVFDGPLAAGQEGEMIFLNLPGTFLLGTSFTEWNPALDEPKLADDLFTLVSIERGRGIGRVVGRNTGDVDLHAAVGVVIVDDASYAS